MDKLKNDLRTSLMANMDVSVVNEQVWQLPVATYGASFARVKRLKMDILMKMLLLAFQEADIRRAATLADMLFVEELFIRDLIDKMQHSLLIRLGSKGYELTDKGYGHLEKGIFEEAVDGGEALISYSAVHDDYRLLVKSSSELDDTLVVYRYALEGQADSERIHELLSTEKNSAEEGFQVIVTDITDCEQLDTEAIPCIEFQLYDQKQDIFYARVWNTRTSAWDETLEKQIEEREIVQWREAMEQEQVEA
ncbi:hypothetical protein [Planococcus sp. ISL-109]|uniref:hypothetical protein n=1 Tax=Planococcus sp. ISL-109 TaxID=2819166 RepID=UPI001BE81243|nr:hypothetical protein [Planococcus sp. ISL-109]MBT2583477.1 hypothetical protein [Planococcus sp. ISL-109]